LAIDEALKGDFRPTQHPFARANVRK